MPPHMGADERIPRATERARRPGRRAPVLLAAALLGFAQRDVAPPRAATWDQVSKETLDPRWVVPAGLPPAREGRGIEWELEAELVRRVALLAEPSAADPGAPRSFGDLVALTRDAGAREGGTREIDALLARLAAAQPELARELAPFARELLCEDALRAKGWDPERDSDRDGLLLARPLTLSERKDEPWASLEGSRLLYQGAALVRADVEALKEAESDFPRYPGRRGTSYESIALEPGSHVRGLDPRGRAFAALRVRFECDLPFPFGSYRCTLRILTRVRDDGLVVSDVLSTSDDFHWLAGRDVLVPVRASDGSPQGLVAVRLFGFDLDGVPDKDDHRRSGLRANLGALKLEAEALSRARGGELRTLEGAVPEFPVNGAPSKR